MKQFIKKAIACGLAVSLAAVFAAGCSKKEETASTGTVKLNGDAIYPLSSEDTLTCWMELNSVLSTKYANFGDTPLAKELEKRTGVKVKYEHPAQGQVAEQFNLLLASNELPDIIRYNWFSTGAEKSINSGYIMSLNEAFEKWAPNVSKLLESNADFKKMVKTDEGNYYVFPFLRENEDLCVYTGPVIRKDWLDKLNMEIPETISEWETMLTAFRDEIGADTPFSTLYTMMNSGFITGAYGITGHYYLDDDGKVKYGPYEDEYLEYLKLMNRWYKEGLLDKNFSSIDGNVLETNILTGRTGATCAALGSGIGTWMSIMENEDPEFELVGAPYPVLNKGDKPQFAKMDAQYTPSGSYAISKNCSNPELAVRFLDYGYGEEGHMLYNFGIEGVSYNVENDYPRLTELLIGKNAESGAVTAHLMGSYSGPFVQDKRLVEQIQGMPQQQEAAKNWADTDGAKHAMPMLLYTEEENKELIKLWGEILTYVPETTYAFIMGKEPLENFDKFTAQLKALGIERTLEIQNQALARYNSR